MLKIIKKYLGFFSFFLVLILAGTGFYLPWVGILGTYASFMGLIAVLIKRKKLIFPAHIKFFVIFLGFCLLSFFWSKDLIQSYNLFLIILSGFGFYLLSFNIGINEKRLKNLLIILGLVYGLIFIFNIFLPHPLIYSLSLPFYSVISMNHVHIGDYFVLVSLISFYYFIKNKKNKYIFLFFLSLILLGASLSRAAYISLFLGLVYIFYKENLLIKYKNIFYLISAGLVILLLTVASQKSIIFSRPYFTQSLQGLVKYPFGVGLGNFGIISKEISGKISGTPSFSFYAHNIIFEFISAIGILSLTFIYWLYKTLKDIFSGNRKNYLTNSIIIALTINFMFDYTYFIPAMLWIWFLLLGLCSKNIHDKKI